MIAWMAHIIRLPALWLALMLCAAPMSPALAEITGMQFGQNFSCGGGGGGGGGGQFYTAGGCAGSPADGQVFSYFVCKFEEIINEALSKTYCAIVDEAYVAVMAALTMSVLFFGMMFLMGVSPFTGKELMIFGGKFAMVMAFATEAEYMIGIGYALFMNIAKEGIIIVLNYLFEGSYSTANDVYKLFDDGLKQIMQLASSDSKKEGGQCKNALFSLMVLMAAAMPPVAMMGMYFMIRLAWVMVRAVFGYCQGILGVTFLVTLSPIYVSFALFKPTRALFEKWIEHLISFSFQMVVVFAFLGMTFNIISKMADDIQGYTQLVKPYNRDLRQPGLSEIFDMCGICEMNPTAPKEKPSCKSDKVMEIGELQKDQDFLHFASTKIFAMIIIFYILDIMMDFVPQMARHLAGPKYAAQIGGGKAEEDVDVSLPGEKRVKEALAKGAANFRGATTPGAMISGFVAGGRQALAGAIDDLVGTAAGGAAAAVILGATRGGRGGGGDGGGDGATVPRPVPGRADSSVSPASYDSTAARYSYEIKAAIAGARATLTPAVIKDGVETSSAVTMSGGTTRIGEAISHTITRTPTAREIQDIKAILAMELDADDYVEAAIYLDSLMTRSDTSEA